MRPFFSDRDWKRLPRTGRHAISGAALKIIWEDVAEALQSGTFESRTDRHLSHNDVTLDEQGWRDVAKLLNSMIGDVQKIASDSGKRLRAADEEGISATVVAMQFELPARHAQQS